MATIYGAVNYSGKSSYIETSQQVKTLETMFNYGVRSVKVNDRYVLTIYDQAYYAGRSVKITGPANIPDIIKYSGGENLRFSNAAFSYQVQWLGPSDQWKAQCCTGQNTSSQCAEYGLSSTTSSQCLNTMATYCTKPENITDPMCKTWCRSNTAYCDAAVRSYCATNPTDSYCSCINSKVDDPRYGLNPLCVDKQCMDYGYATTNMRNTQCPSVINCTVKNQLVNSGVVFSNNVATDQNCGTNDSTTNPTSDDSNDVSGTEPFLQKYLYVFIFFVFILFVVALYYVFDDEDQKNIDLL
jgi:hypothetical protein